MATNLVNLLEQLVSNHEKLKDVEQEVDRIIAEEGIETVHSLFFSPNPLVTFYSLTIVEGMLKAKSRPIIELILFTTECINTSRMNHSCQIKMAKIFAQMGIIAWPNNFPTFFNTIFDLMTKELLIGYLTLEKFLYLVHNTTEINEDRRNELKRAMIVISGVIFEILAREIHIPETISIYTYLIPILPKPVDFSIIFKRGAEFADRALDFFPEAINAKYCDEAFSANIVAFSKKIGVDSRMIECFILLKEYIYVFNVDMYSYVFKAISESIYTFSASLKFWQILFKKSISDNRFINLAKEVMAETIKFTMTTEEEPDSVGIDDLENDILHLFSLISLNYPQANTQFLLQCSESIPRKYVTALIRCNKERHNLKFNIPYLNALTRYLDSNSECIEIMSYFDLSDKDSCKLASQIILKFNIEKSILRGYYMNIKATEHTDEMFVNIVLKLEDNSLVHVIMQGNFDNSKALRLFYLLKHNPSVCPPYFSPFYIYFLGNPPFDRCFAIIALIYTKFKNVPKEIFEKIYVSISDYSLQELNYCTTDLILKLNEELQIPFVERIYLRLINEWKDFEDQIALCNATKALINVLEVLIVKNRGSEKELQYTNILIDFLREPEATIFKKINIFYTRSKFQFDTSRFLYCLLVCYNSSDLVDNSNDIIGLLIECIKKEDGVEAFAQFNFDSDQCNRIRAVIRTDNSKTGRNLMREMLICIKGKPLAKLYQNNERVKSQNLFAKKEKNSSSDFDIESLNVFKN